MAKTPKPWYRKSHRTWYVTIEGVQHPLGKDKKAAQDRFFELMRTPRERRSVCPHSLPAIIDAFLEWFLLAESDLIFDGVLLEDMLAPDRIAISRVLPWMNGTTVTLDQRRQVTRFGTHGQPAPDQVIYKTVNMYSFSLSSWRRVTDRLDLHISAGRVDRHYETVFAELVAEGKLSLQAVFFDNERWYEVDTLMDLGEAERLFPRGRRRRPSRA